MEVDIKTYRGRQQLQTGKQRQWINRMPASFSRQFVLVSWLNSVTETITTSIIKCHYDENRIFSIEAILKPKQVACLLFSNISFCSGVIQAFKKYKLAMWWCHTLNQILIKYDEKGCLSQFVSEMFDFLQWDSTKYAPQLELNSFVAMTTYWVPGLPNIKGISGHLWRPIFTFANGASYTWSNRHINMLAWVCGLV